MHGSARPADRCMSSAVAGGRGKQACEKFVASRLTNVVNVEGGTPAWADGRAAGGARQESDSLERQVRIAAGSLVLIGVALGWLVHPAFIGLSAFVGAAWFLPA